jgi:hypothetical protein
MEGVKGPAVTYALSRFVRFSFVGFATCAAVLLLFAMANFVMLGPDGYAQARKIAVEQIQMKREPKGGYQCPQPESYTPTPSRPSCW